MPRITGIDSASQSQQKNYIMNGDMAISQRNTSFTSPSIAYTLDRWLYAKIASSATHTVTQDSDVPSVAQAGMFFKNSMRLNLTGADTTIAAGDFVGVTQYVEGYNFSNFAQKAFVLSFWVKATATGTYSVSFRNSSADRSFVSTYTVNSAGTWEKKTIKVLASPSTGGWNYTNGVGLQVTFVVAGGTSFQTSSLNTWNSDGLNVANTQVNGVNTGATDFRITGVMLNEGIVAAPFKLFSSGSISEELDACKRYYQHTYPYGTFPGQAAGIAHVTQPVNNTFRDWQDLEIEMRATPSYTLYSPATGASGVIRDVSGGVDRTAVPDAASPKGFRISCDTAVSGNITQWHGTCNAEL